MTVHAPRTPAQAQFSAANRLMAQGDRAGAEALFRQAIAQDPGFGEAVANLGWLREQAGDLQEAQDCYWRAATLRPANLQIRLNLGALLLRRKQFAAAERVQREALALAPDSPAAQSSLGMLLACLQREEEAEHCYRAALARDPCYAKARFNLSYLLLRQGRMEEGWPALEARSHFMHLSAYFTCPRWAGESVKGKTIVIGFEGGHGDSIQFCRYALLLRDMGASEVTIVCQSPLASLLERLVPAGTARIIPAHEAVSASAWDFWTPVMSLPLLCQQNPGSPGMPVFAPIPYLAADPVQQRVWKAQLPATGLHVGLVWRGNPDFENDADRSLPSLAALAPLAAVAGIHFVSLQKGAGEDEACTPPAGMALLPSGGQLRDFADTAALLANLDLVIAVDTAVAHLAGSMGVPCWVLLPDYRCDWRWQTLREDTPWYPGSMRLFRQPAGGGWPEVVARVAHELADWRDTRLTLTLP
jgi:Tfp pilus assembly protein PilF